MSDTVAESVAREDGRRAAAVRVAVARHESDYDVVVDDDAEVAYRDGGYWVAATVWVDADAAEGERLRVPPAGTQSPDAPPAV